MFHRTLIAAGLTGLLVLTGCGDSDDNVGQIPADPLASVPDSAQASAAGLVAYLEVLADTPADDRLPVSLEGVMLTQRDDTEPIELQ